LRAQRKTALLLRKHGHYNLGTLALFNVVWRKTKRPRDFLNYLNFKRDLGFVIRSREAKLLEDFLKMDFFDRIYHRITQFHLRQVRNFIIEQKQRKETPWVEPQYRSSMLRWLSQQHAWNSQLKEKLSHAKRIAVVGNHPKLKGSKLGDEIDDADFVVRFNLFQSSETNVEDIGTKLDLWVTAPAYKGPQPQLTPFILVTGPAMLSKQQNWHALRYTQSPLVDTSLSVWRNLVMKLGAPPSAGVATLAFIKSQTSATIELYGFDLRPLETGINNEVYHHAKQNHRATGRHNWSAERVWLQYFSKQHNLVSEQTHD